jgi:integrase
VIEQLERDGIRVQPFTTINTRKAKAIDALALAFERGEIRIPNDPVLVSGLLAYQTTTGGRDSDLHTMIAMATGARRGELLALKWADIDGLRGILSFTKSLEETARDCASRKRRASGRAGSKSDRPRLRLCGSSKSARSNIGASLVPDYTGDLVFCQPDGSYLIPHLVSQTIVRRLRRAGDQECITPRSATHAHASHLLSNGVPLPAVSARLGHADVNVTARIYSHMLPDDDERAADAWESVMNTPIQ